MIKEKTEMELVLDVPLDKNVDVETKREQLTRECELLIKEAQGMGIRANFRPESASDNIKGDAVAMGVIILTPIVAESVRWLFEYIKGRIKAKVQVGYSYDMTIKKGRESKSISIRASNLTEEETNRIIESIKDFTG